MKGSIVKSFKKSMNVMLSRPGSPNTINVVNVINRHTVYGFHSLKYLFFIHLILSEYNFSIVAKVRNPDISIKAVTPISAPCFNEKKKEVPYISVYLHV